MLVQYTVSIEQDVFTITIWALLVECRSTKTPSTEEFFDI